MASTPKIFSIGHGSKPLHVFLNRLLELEITVLVDVRTFPYSRFSPHFNRSILQGALEECGIFYLYRGNNLGGKGENIEYEETIEELAGMAKNGIRVCMMCSESDYRKCHRYSTLAPSFVRHGLRVLHIKYGDEPTTEHLW